MRNTLQLNCCYVGGYPRANYVGVRLQYETRRFRVTAITEEPVQAVTLLMDPLVRRIGRRLTVWDFDKGAERTMYEGALMGVREIEAPAELTGWQVISGPQVVVQYSQSKQAAERCVALFRSDGKEALAVPVRLPNLASNLHRETA